MDFETIFDTFFMQDNWETSNPYATPYFRVHGTVRTSDFLEAIRPYKIPSADLSDDLGVCMIPHAHGLEFVFMDDFEEDWYNCYVPLEKMGAKLLQLHTSIVDYTITHMP